MRSSETSVDLCRTKREYVSEDGTIHTENRSGFVVCAEVVYWEQGVEG